MGSDQSNKILKPGFTLRVGSHDESIKTTKMFNSVILADPMPPR